MFQTAVILVSLVAATLGNAPSSYHNGNWKPTNGPYGDVVHKTGSFEYDPSPYYGYHNNKPSYAPHQSKAPSYGYNKYETRKSYGSYSPSY